MEGVEVPPSLPPRPRHLHSRNLQRCQLHQGNFALPAVLLVILSSQPASISNRLCVCSHRLPIQNVSFLLPSWTSPPRFCVDESLAPRLRYRAPMVVSNLTMIYHLVHDVQRHHSSHHVDEHQKDDDEHHVEHPCRRSPGCRRRRWHIDAGFSSISSDPDRARLHPCNMGSAVAWRTRAMTFWIFFICFLSNPWSLSQTPGM